LFGVLRHLMLRSGRGDMRDRAAPERKAEPAGARWMLNVSWSGASVARRGIHGVGTGLSQATERSTESGARG